MLKSTFALELDGQEALIILLALQEQLSQGSKFQRQMNTVLMQKIAKAKVKFHHDSYQIMASTYHLQVIKEHV